MGSCPFFAPFVIVHNSVKLSLSVKQFQVTNSCNRIAENDILIPFGCAPGRNLVFDGFTIKVKTWPRCKHRDLSLGF